MSNEERLFEAEAELMVSLSDTLREYGYSEGQIDLITNCLDSLGAESKAEFHSAINAAVDGLTDKSAYEEIQRIVNELIPETV